MSAVKKPLAVVTMAFNEADMLPIWSRYYASQVGAENCYVLDHGSDDGSTTGLACNVLRLPNSPFVEAERSASVSDFCSSLFFYYDHVLFTDTDEMVVADPNVAKSLAEYAGDTDLPPYVSCFGMDLIHVEEEEPLLDVDQPILAQRSWVRPLHALCKPTFVSERMDWRAGFHSHNLPLVLRDLYLFHLAYMDVHLIYKRQVKRNLSPPVGGGGAHHRLHPVHMLEHVREEYMKRGHKMGVELGGCPEMTDFIENGVKHADELWEIPQRFKTAF